MTDDIMLSPFGTATELYQGATPSDESRKLPALLRQLAGTVQDFNLEKEMVQLAYEAAGWQSGLSPEEQQAFVLMVLCSLIMQRQGSTRMPLQDGEGLSKLTGILHTLLKPQEPGGSRFIGAEETLTLIKKVISAGRADGILGKEGDFKPFIFDGANLYHYKMLNLEKRIVDRLKAIISAKQKPFNEQQVQASLLALNKGPAPLEDEQKEAVQKAIQSSFCIITGGPGTGKTTVIVSIVRTLLRLGVEPGAIALAAPTGKAANRMGESLQAGLTSAESLDEAMKKIPEPRTIHRLLGYSPEQDAFTHHKNNPLLEEVVIIDEASMIDLYLVERLLGAMRKDGRLILIGDAEQLPSVDAGAVFKDLVSVNSAYVVLLEKSHRMKEEGPGKTIYAMAQAVRAGSEDQALQHDSVRLRKEVGEILFTGVELYDPRAQKRGLSDFLDIWAERFRPAGADNEQRIKTVYKVSREGLAPEVHPLLDRIFSDINRYKILGLTRAYRSGVDAINSYFHERAVSARLREGAGDTEYLPGEPVMMQHNDYDKKIFNGDQGIILNATTGNGAILPMAIFKQGAGYAAFHLDSLRASLKHSYAITVHKSQGSEFDHVALILPDQEIPILTRELIYTGVTRSKQSVTIVGSRDILKAGVRQKMARFSGIAERMAVG